MVAHMRKNVACRHCGESFVPQPDKQGYVDECPPCFAERTRQNTAGRRAVKKADSGWKNGKATVRDVVVKLSSRVEGATLPELMEVLGWQAHSVRGYISNLKKGGLNIESSKVDGVRTYKNK